MLELRVDSQPIYCLNSQCNRIHLGSKKHPSVTCTNYFAHLKNWVQTKGTIFYSVLTDLDVNTQKWMLTLKYLRIIFVMSNQYVISEQQI